MASSEARKRALVLCTGNSCRSQMAEGWINHHAPLDEIRDHMLGAPSLWAAGFDLERLGIGERG